MSCKALEAFDGHAPPQTVESIYDWTSERTPVAGCASDYPEDRHLSGRIDEAAKTPSHVVWALDGPRGCAAGLWVCPRPSHLLRLSSCRAEARVLAALFSGLRGDRRRTD